MRVQIESRESLMALSEKTFQPGTAVISITDPDSHQVELTNAPEHILRLQFDDVSQDIFQQVLGRKPSVREMHMLVRRFRMFDSSHARQIAKFLHTVKPKRLICQCEFGQSRSAAVAAAILEHDCKRGIRIFADVRYDPNKYVYHKLLRTLRAMQKVL